MRKLILLWLFGVTLVFGSQSATITTGTATATLPSAAWTSNLGAATQSMRWEFRVHTIGAPPNYMIGLAAQQMTTTGSTVFMQTMHNPPSGDSYTQAMGPLACCSAGDYLVRLQRDTSLSQYSFELCATLTGTCISSIESMSSTGQASWAGWQFYLNPGYSIDFLRWFSTAVPVGTPIPIAGAAGDLADWEFEGSLVDSVHGLTFSGASASYSNTPSYAPTCIAGPQQSFRAGYSAQLDGTSSKPLDGGTTLTYTWQQLPGISPLNAVWHNSQHKAQPPLDGLVAGSYDFQLTVKDGSGQSTTCVVHDGAVVTDANGVVVTNNPAVDQLLGQMLQWEPMGTSSNTNWNPWPWMDDRHKYLADVQISNLDNYYNSAGGVPFYNIPATGTISVSTATNTMIVGTGTHFTTDVCQGPSNPTTPQTNMALIVWWNGGQNRRAVMPVSCSDDTHLTIGGNYAWKPPSGYPQSETGLNYSIDNTKWLIWQEGGNAQYPINYYDNVAAFYALYYRTGIDTYLAYARKLADEFWYSPMIDQGLSGIIDFGSAWGYPGRALSAIGLVLRALDTGDGHPDMWAGLHNIWNTDIYYATSPNWTDRNSVPYGVADQREDGYRLMRLAMCSLYDTDPNMRAQCKSAIQTYVTNTWTPVRNFYGTGYYPSWVNNTYDSAVNTQDMYLSVDAGGNVTFYSTAGRTVSSQYFPGAIWMWTCPNPGVFSGCGRPGGNSGGDPAWYHIAYVDPTHGTLVDTLNNPVPYAGTPGYKGFQIGGPWNAGTQGLGWGNEPFMQAIIASGMDMAAQAMFDGNYDPATGALLEQYATEALTWVQTYALYMPAKGMWYYTGTVNCPVGAEDPVTCGQPNPASPAGSRILDAEAVRGAMFTWFHTGQPAALKDFVDFLVNAMFAKPGTCPPGSSVCVPDGYYLNNYDNGQTFTSGPPPSNANPKWFGMPFGLNPIESWPAMRLGGAQAAGHSTVHVAFTLSSIPGATHVNVLVTSPAGAVTSTSCSDSPCNVTVDTGRGRSLVRLQYLSVSNAVLATQEVPSEAGQ